jgi:hypothetical protein
MDTKTLTAAKAGTTDIVRIYAGSVFIWPDPWDDIWDNGGGITEAPPTFIGWDTVWYNVWTNKTRA